MSAIERRRILRRIAQGPADGVIEAWRNWSATWGLDDYGAESFTLLPWIYARLVACGADEATTGRLKGIARYHWTKNQRSWVRLGRVFDALEAIGAEPIVVGGPALDWGDAIRSFDDARVVVSRAHARSAIARLAELGWTPSVPPRFECGTSSWLTDENQNGLHLAWAVLPEATREGYEQSFWRDAIVRELHGRRVRTLSPDAQLLRVLVDGVLRDTPLEWPLDAGRLISSGDVNWPRFRTRTVELHLSLLVLEAERRLEHTALPTPTRVALREARQGLIERYELRYKLGRVGYPNVVVVWLDHHRRRGTFVRGFDAPLVEHYGVRRRRDLIGRAVRRLTRR